MGEKEELFTIQVLCYAGFRGEESPQRFFLNERRIEVEAILDRWLAPAHRYFKVRGDDGASYIIRHNVNDDRWQLTLFSSTPYNSSREDR